MEIPTCLLYLIKLESVPEALKEVFKEAEAKTGYISREHFVSFLSHSLVRSSELIVFQEGDSRRRRVRLLFIHLSSRVSFFSLLFFLTVDHFLKLVRCVV
mmetsp:Transcript_10739/g.27137  ORF Transcript_10739/g.27137 Transcript_10739/m.27137 type:complete len:100 (+) Transcript_10739:4548-4847(+)